MRPYNLVGKKEFKAFCNKNIKKKHVLKRIDSAVSNSRYSNTVRSQETDPNAYITKEDLLDSLNRTQKENFTRDKCPTL